MALPLVVAPIFAIYSHRHNLTEQTQVDIQYKYQTNDVSTLDDLVIGNVYHLDELSLTVPNSNGEPFSLMVLSCEYLDDISASDRYSDELLIYDFNSSLNDCGFQIDISTDSIVIYAPNDFSYINYYLEGESINLTLVNIDFYILDYYPLVNTIGYFADYDYLPTRSEFNIIQSVHIQDANSDIMSVFVGNYANAIDKYFNYDNVVNFGTLYSWLNTTFFSGNAPLGFFIFWHLLEYWLLTSLLWLLFDVLIYVPMLVHRWLDKASIS